MPGFARRPLALLVCCLFAGTQTAHAAVEASHPVAPAAPASHAIAPSDETAESAQDAVPVKLRMERKFNRLARPKPAAPLIGGGPALSPAPELKRDDAYPMFIVADQMEGHADDVTDAEGHVELRKTGSLLFSDKLRYWPLDDEIEATGNVRLEQEGAEIEAPYLRMKLSEQIGYAEKARYHFTREVDNRFFAPQQLTVTVASSNASTSTNSGAPMMLNIPGNYGLPTTLRERRLSEASGEAERIDFEGENQIRLTSGSYSTCKPGERDWYLEADSTLLDYDQDQGVADHAVLRFKGVPLFYAPKATFPLNHQRQSGFLHPFWSASSRTGFDVTVPYYWSIAPNYDLTLNPRYMSKHGMQLAGELRYFDQNTPGSNWRAEYLPQDDATGKSRYGYWIQHQQNLGQGVSTAINWQGVSDDKYWVDMTSRLLQTSQVQLPRQIVLGYSPASWLQTNMQVLRYQTLSPDPANPVTRPYFIEPQLNLFGYKANVFKTDLSVVGQYTRFTHDDVLNKDRGDRMVFYPQMSLPVVAPGYQIIPKIGMHMTSYALDRATVNLTEADRINRVLPTFTLDSTVFFERETSLAGKGYIQTLEPRLYYVNIPYKNQSNIPIFDSGLTDFNFAQIFAENRYSGYDRLNDANQLTAAVTTRMLDAETGAERFKAMLGQRYYFKSQRVGLPTETLRTEDSSNLVAAVNGLVAPKTYGDVAWEYNYRDSVSERFSAGIRYQPELGKALSASYRYVRDPLTGNSTVDQIDLAGQWPLSAQWYAVGRYNYSLRDKQLLEAIAGLEYNAGCWATRVVAQRLEAIAGTPNTTVFFQLELLDFASIGANPMGLLRRSIPGYGKTNEMPTSSVMPSYR